MLVDHRESGSIGGFFGSGIRVRALSPEPTVDDEPGVTG